MRNPWLDIPLGDYEAHMALPTAGQAQLIADELDALVRTHSPRSLAVLGCAGGNGLECLVGNSVTPLSQLPHDTLAHVSPSPYTSLQLLAPGMRLVPQDELKRRAQQAGFVAVHSRTTVSDGGTSSG